MESMVLLTKPMGIVTPQVLSIVVIVAPRLISYRTIKTRSYRTSNGRRRLEIVSYKIYKIVSYRALVIGRERG